MNSKPKPTAKQQARLDLMHATGAWEEGKYGCEFTIKGKVSDHPDFPGYATKHPELDAYSVYGYTIHDALREAEFSFRCLKDDRDPH